jgi:hypothetical protein
MVEHARRARPQLDFRVADMRTVQLGRSFDAITCVGMTLSYQHTLDDLQTTIDSIAAHADVGSVLVVQTLTEPIQHTDTSVTTTALYDRPVEIATTYEWRDPFVIMRRRWAFADGEIAEDHIRRRVWQRPELQARLSRAGLQLVDTRAGYLVCVVAATHL